MTSSSTKFPQFIFSSKYHRNMRRLSCKIFNDFFIPELEKKELDYGPGHKPVVDWSISWFSECRVYERNQDRPLDLDPDRNWNYYPAHPQIRKLTHVLREYGLFRDEHRDFSEEMKMIKIARGKKFPKPRGSRTS